MPLFAVTIKVDAHTALLLGLGLLFWLFVVVSFIGVIFYVTGQLRCGELINSANAPIPFKLSSPSGWIFSVCVLELIFLQSPWYVVLVLVGTLGLLIENGRSAEAQFGLTRLKPSKLLVGSFIVFGAVMVVEVPLMAISVWLLDALHMPHPEQESVEAFRQFNKPSVILGFIFQAVLLFPVIEELFFRGFLFTFLKNYTSTWLALVLSAGVFAFAHVNLGAALPLWFLGIVLGLAYENTGSLLLPIGIHACWNLVTALSLLLDKGSS
jgi:membrane protease YdiL (CAAX protease family)